MADECLYTRIILVPTIFAWHLFCNATQPSAYTFVPIFFLVKIGTKLQKAQSTKVPDNIVTHEYLNEDICDGEISNDPNVRNHDHVANRKNDAIHDANDINDDDSQQEIEYDECKECTNEEKCVPCIMLKAYDDPNSSYGSYEVDEESIESIMAKSRAFKL